MSKSKSSAAVAVVHTEQESRIPLLPIDLIDSSPTNPRKTFDPIKLQELAESIKAHGLMQPVVVRPHPRIEGRLELVCGERRYRASKLAGAHGIAAVLVDLTDRQVLEVQLIENRQRDDVHPLEEADGFRALHERHGVPVEELAAKLGLSRAYIYGRLKLCALVEVARAAFLEGKLTASTALLVARVPPALQPQATQQILEGGPWENGERAPMSARAAAAHVQRQFMLSLADAPFRTTDPKLTKAGACTSCPKRTGAQPELFADVPSADVCTDPGCFEEKREAGWQARVKQAKRDGHKVLTDEEVKALGNLHYPVGYVALDKPCRDDEAGRTYRQLLGKGIEGQAITWARTPDGKVHELVPRAVANKLLVKVGVEVEPDEDDDEEGGGPRAAEQGKWQKEREAKTLLALRVVEALVAAVEQRDASARALWMALLRGQISLDTYCLEQALERRGVEVPENEDDERYDDKLVEFATKDLTDAQLRGLVAEVCIPVESSGHRTKFEEIEGLVDVAAVRAHVEKDTGVKLTPEPEDEPVPKAEEKVEVEKYSPAANVLTLDEERDAALIDGIRDSMSGESLNGGKIRPPVKIDGQLWVATGGTSHGTYRAYTVWGLIERSAHAGGLLTYSELLERWEKGTAVRGDLTGLGVKSKGKIYQLDAVRRTYCWGKRPGDGLEAVARDDDRECRTCGCTSMAKCDGGCTFVEDDLCSACVAAASATAGTCRVCRCSDDDPCGPTDTPCAWADSSETLCTSCVGHENEKREETWKRIVETTGVSTYVVSKRFGVTSIDVVLAVMPAITATPATPVADEKPAKSKKPKKSKAVPEAAA